jgi:CO/xanthine dehydrogenase FAD-binding subunit
MKPPPFEYLAPTTLAEALERLDQYGDDAKILAGGQSLMPLMNMRLARPRVVVDVNRLPELAYISSDTDGGLAVGALTRQRTVERSALVQTSHPLLAAVMPAIGHVQIRNRGTIGGSIVHADPAAELPALSLALEAEFVLRRSTQQRVIKAHDFFLTYLTTAIEPMEILTEIRFPPWGPRWRWGFQEVCRRDGDFALVGAMALMRVEDSAACQDVRLTLFGVGGVPLRLYGVEGLLAGRTVDARLLDEVATGVAETLEPDGDIHASAEYRREVGGVVARRALEAALRQGEGDDRR